MPRPVAPGAKERARVLRATQDLSVREIAARLGIAPSTAHEYTADIPTEVRYYRECAAAGCFVRFASSRRHARYCSKRCGNRQRKRTASAR